MAEILLYFINGIIEASYDTSLCYPMVGNSPAGAIGGEFSS